MWGKSYRFKYAAELLDKVIKIKCDIRRLEQADIHMYIEHTITHFERQHSISKNIDYYDERPHVTSYVGT